MSPPAEGSLVAMTAETLFNLVEPARRQAFAEGKTLLEVLEGQSGLDRDAFVSQVAALLGYEGMAMRDLQAQEPAFDCLPYGECVQRRLVALRSSDRSLMLVLTDPFDGVTESWAQTYVKVPARLALAHADDVAAYLAQQEERLRAMEEIVGELGGATSDERIDDISLARIGDDDGPIVKLVNSTIYDALKLQASDIHLECDSTMMLMKYRIDGVLVQIGQVNGLDVAEQVISRIKVMAELDIAERRIPQDGRFKVRVNGREIDFRVSIMPNIFGEDAVLRLLDRRALTEQAQSLTLEHLGFDAVTMTQIRRLSAKPHGMLLATGPTGSGKTTTLYAAITEIHSGRDKVITIEDPVEYRLPRVLQIPVNEKKGLTFARGLRSILRHDPDKIMVGEIRDGETAQIAVQAALTGHLVFTTVHANSAFDVLGRFMHMGVDPYSFASALNGIVAQRLLRMNCPQCSVDHVPLSAELDEAGLGVEDVSSWTFRTGAGCGHCRGTGYKGRRAVAEVLVLNDVLRELIVDKAPASRLREEARRVGMRSIRDLALQCVAAGETTLAEVARVAG